MNRGSGRQIQGLTLKALMQTLIGLPPIREELVSRVRSEINEGRYETPEKLDIVIERLIEDLR
jgi:hypothetical protein